MLGSELGAWVVEAGLWTGVAVDWTVVSVVVIDRSDGVGDENVLFLSPSVLVAVVFVPAPEGATSDAVVSAVVARVGALDLGGAWLS